MHSLDIGIVIDHLYNLIFGQSQNMLVAGLGIQIPGKSYI